MESSNSLHIRFPSVFPLRLNLNDKFKTSITSSLHILRLLPATVTSKFQEGKQIDGTMPLFLKSEYCQVQALWLAVPCAGGCGCGGCGVVLVVVCLSNPKYCQVQALWLAVPCAGEKVWRSYSDPPSSRETGKIPLETTSTIKTFFQNKTSQNHIEKLFQNKMTNGSKNWYDVM